LENSLEEERLRGIAYTEDLEAEFVLNADLEERGSVYVVGSNNAGQLGLGDLISRETFTVVPATRGMGVRHVAAGYDVSFAVTEDHDGELKKCIWFSIGCVVVSVIRCCDGNWSIGLIESFFSLLLFAQYMFGVVGEVGRWG